MTVSSFNVSRTAGDAAGWRPEGPSVKLPTIKSTTHKFPSTDARRLKESGRGIHPRPLGGDRPRAYMAAKAKRGPPVFSLSSSLEPFRACDFFLASNFSHSF